MQELVGNNWLWIFAALWLVGAWGLSLPFSKQRSSGSGPTLDALKRKGIGPAAYVKIEYRIPHRSKTTLEKVLKNSPEAKSIYLRAEFFLRYCSAFRPHGLLRDWYKARKWQSDRLLYEENFTVDIDQAIGDIRDRDLSRLYQPRPLPLENPLALSFPLLPTQFSLFVLRKFAYVHSEGSGIVEPGMYRCDVIEWRNEDSFALSIDLEGVKEQKLRIDQGAMMDAIRLQKAAIDSVSFLTVPIYVLTFRERKIPRLRKEQTAAANMAVRKATPREFGVLDSKLLKVFGGINPVNLMRQSWFYHPEFGIKPDQAKYNRLISRANGDR